MAAGPSTYLKNNLLNAVFNSSAFSVSGNAFLQVHSGDPGSAGTSNTITGATTRQQYSTAAASGTVANDAIIAFSMTSGGSVSWLSAWDASATGNLLWNIQLSSSGTYASGGTCRIYTGDLTFTF